VAMKNAIFWDVAPCRSCETTSQKTAFFIDTVVPSLYQHVEVFWLLSQPLPHLCNFQMSLREFLNPVVNHFTWQTLPTVNMKHFFINILCIESCCPQKRTTERCSSVVCPHARSPFWLLKPVSEHAHGLLLPRL
jgi:hypothetical protein